MMNQIFMWLFVGFCLLHLIGEGMKSMKIRYFTKPFLMPLLLLYYVFSAPEIQVWTILAILGGWFGDLLLMIPDPKKTRKYFKFGLISFLLGHIFYIVAFLTSPIDYSKFSLWLIALWVVFIVFGIFIFKTLKPHAGKMEKPIMVYVIVIIVMAISSTFMSGAVYQSTATYAILGAAIFMISDAINAYNKFAKEIPYERIYTMSTYLTGQCLIVYSLILAQYVL